MFTEWTLQFKQQKTKQDETQQKSSNLGGAFYLLRPDVPNFGCYLQYQRGSKMLKYKSEGLAFYSISLIMSFVLNYKVDANNWERQNVHRNIVSRYIYR